MPKFLAVHPLPTFATMEEAFIPIGKKAKADSTADAYWVRSWCPLDEKGKIFRILCEWNAVSAEAVRKVQAKVPVPLKGVYPMLVVDSEDSR
jgi:hypothetical protein